MPRVANTSYRYFEPLARMITIRCWIGMSRTIIIPYDVDKEIEIRENRKYNRLNGYGPPLEEIDTSVGLNWFNYET